MCPREIPSKELILRTKSEFSSWVRREWALPETGGKESDYNAVSISSIPHHSPTDLKHPRMKRLPGISNWELEEQFAKKAKDVCRIDCNRFDNDTRKCPQCRYEHLGIWHRQLPLNDGSSTSNDNWWHRHWLGNAAMESITTASRSSKGRIGNDVGQPRKLCKTHENPRYT